ncbi:MAG: ATP-binding protein [Oscillospiraceae bacterium]|nr:ATP-binding protein [Oscillospiraceae bacterium]
MTIKKRLFRSNILMLVLPLIATLLLFSAVRVVTGMVTADGISHAVHGRGESANIVYIDQSHADAFLRFGNYTEVDAEISVFQSDSGSYLIVLPDHMITEDTRNRAHLTVILSLAFLAIIFATNYALTRRITRSIETPIDVLVNGVQEISNGNLTYRIDYQKGDEFDAVCADFNEMASRLLEMVNERQRDEQNRKELIAGISHDLRTPLTSIKAYLEGIQKGVAATPEMQAKYLATIQSKTEDIEYIISQLFLFSKMDVGDFPFSLETVDIGEELDKMIAGLADEYSERGLDISLEENLQGARVSIDPVQFRNVVQNILNNCVKYCAREDARAELVCRADDNRVRITIQDNGPGVPEEALPHLFDVFYRGDTSRNNPSNGSGLGLAISSKIIERLNGAIIAENAPNGGLNILISLPIAKEGE